MSSKQSDRLLDRPIIILGCNRSGTTLLFRNLGEHPLTWSYYEESQHVYYRHRPCDDEQGDRLIVPPSPAEADAIRRELYADAHNREVLRDLPLLQHIPRKLLIRSVNRFYKRPPIRLVEKTPANSLRVPFLAALFPDARFVFLVRRAEAVISSLMEGWKNWSGTGASEWTFTKWHYLAPPGWRQWKGRSLEEICAFQWLEATQTAWEDLQRHCAGRHLLVRHEDAMAAPREVYQKIQVFCELPPSGYLDRLLTAQEGRLFTHGGSPPRPGKWRELHGRQIETVRPMFAELMGRLYPEGP